MRVDPGLKKLVADFRRWRKRKQHVREQIPEDLMKMARRAIPTHGASIVAQAIGVEHARLTKGPRQRAERAGKGRGASVQRAKPPKHLAPPLPSYSRLELPISSASPRPVAEVETPVGLKLKIFEVTPETVSLLSALTAAGRAP